MSYEHPNYNGKKERLFHLIGYHKGDHCASGNRWATAKTIKRNIIGKTLLGIYRAATHYIAVPEKVTGISRLKAGTRIFTEDIGHPVIVTDARWFKKLKPRLQWGFDSLNRRLPL